VYRILSIMARCELQGQKLWKTLNTPESSSYHAVVVITNGGQLEIQTSADSNIFHVGKQVQI